MLFLFHVNIHVIYTYSSNGLVRSLSSFTRYTPLGVTLISGITGSAMKDNVIKGSNPFFIPIECAFDIILSRRSFTFS